MQYLLNVLEYTTDNTVCNIYYTNVLEHTIDNIRTILMH